MEIPVLRHRFLSLVMTPPAACFAVRRRGSPASYLNTVVDQVVGRAAKARRQTNGAWKRRSAVGGLVVVASVGKTSGLHKTNGSRMTNWTRKTNEARKGRRPEMPDDSFRFVSVHDPNRQRRRLDSQSAIEPLKGHWTAYRANVSELLKSPSFSEKAGNSSHYFLVVRCSDHVFSGELHLIGYHEYFL